MIGVGRILRRSAVFDNVTTNSFVASMYHGQRGKKRKTRNDAVAYSQLSSKYLQLPSCSKSDYSARQSCCCATFISVIPPVTDSTSLATAVSERHRALCCCLELVTIYTSRSLPLLDSNTILLQLHHHEGFTASATGSPWYCFRPS